MNHHNLEGKTCLITGATNGIGRVTAVELARMGAELFLTCRDKGRADETVAEIRNSTGTRTSTCFTPTSVHRVRLAARRPSSSPREGRYML